MDPLEKLLFDAKTIAGIKKGEKINTSQEFINIEPKHLGQSFLRAWCRESRERAVINVCQRMELLIEFSKLLLESKYLNATETPNVDYLMIEREKRILNIKKIHMALANACDGIDNLCETYSDDNNVLGALKPLLVRIEGHVSALSKYLMEIGEYNDPKTNQLYLNILTK
jgi:hypothetical protein